MLLACDLLFCSSLLPETELRELEEEMLRRSELRKQGGVSALLDDRVSAEDARRYLEQKYGMDLVCASFLR